MFKYHQGYFPARNKDNSDHLVLLVGQSLKEGELWTLETFRFYKGPLTPKKSSGTREFIQYYLTFFSQRWGFQQNEGTPFMEKKRGSVFWKYLNYSYHENRTNSENKFWPIKLKELFYKWVEIHQE